VKDEGLSKRIGLREGNERGGEEVMGIYEGRKCEGRGQR
jgi:hypothetical protein